MARRFRTRWLILGLIGAILAAALYASFREQPVTVDLGTVARGPMVVEIASDARTRVADTYVISSSVAGRLRRVTLEAGDTVEKGETVLARISPALPVFLDARSRAQAQAAVDEAEAALRAAEADSEAARAERDLAQSAYDRTRRLATSGTVSTTAVENARATAGAAEARLGTAEAAILMRRAAVTSAQTVLDQAANGETNGTAQEIDVTAPASGTVLQIMALSETAIAAGTPIMEIGDVSGDLEVVSDILSRDAVRIAPGQRVRISDWGGPQDLDAVVLRVDPMAVTKVSALGVEEQRVNVVIRFTGPPEARAGLGHGFQVDAHIVTWETPDALLIPSAALIRGADGWSAFVLDGSGRAERRTVAIGANNGTDAVVTEGLAQGDQVVLYPTAGIGDGTLLTRRATPG